MVEPEPSSVPCQESHPNLAPRHLCTHRKSLRYTTPSPAFLGPNPAILLRHRGWRATKRKLQSALLALGFDTWCRSWNEMIAVTVLWSGGQGEGLLPECCGRVRRKAGVSNKARCRNWVTCHCLKTIPFLFRPE
jgi:hypothetical protein